MTTERLRQQVLSTPHTAMIIFSDISISYLSGFTGHAATVLLTDKANYLITDYRYVEQAEKEAHDYIVISRDRANQSLASLLTEIIIKDSCQSVSFECEQVTVAQWHDVKQAIAAQGITEFTPIYQSVEKLRRVKNSEELNAIRQAAAIADQALANILPLVKVGITEKELANELDYQMAKLGSEELSFATILLFGERSAMPHGVPSSRALNHGDIILIDFGAVINGYRSDMTRTFIFGEASEQQREIYQLVQNAQQAAIDAVKAGVRGDAIYQESANILQASKYKEFAGEGLGHGVGLQLHEQPFLGPDCHYEMELGCVVTIEPGIYIPGWGGIRIEDDVVLNEHGLEIITQSPKALTVL
ncbi:M24 family metallopeptidase [Litorilituus lipolyticus]|uniref:M24 family metallopeptidase n=1 Tax=Litorilituus lipolyticus TaxID=2491017 RepID=A0A502KVM7_9GAMM|nr:aminopeptidase P family protein [Litorilituus lipolyticus]TPH14041.1 M24 family metallopeptidase [Litorilituus lipolyticus]